MNDELRKELLAESEVNGFHQAILNVAYIKWQKKELKYNTYAGMIEWADENLGTEYANLILLGKYNQQVGNGGHQQYFTNGYATDGSNKFIECISELSLHYKMIEYTKKYLNELDNYTKIIDIMEIFSNDDSFSEEICENCYGTGYIYDFIYDEELEEYIEEDVDCSNCDGNGHFDQLEYNNNYDLDEKYYEINESWMKNLEKYAENLIKSERNK